MTRNIIATQCLYHRDHTSLFAPLLHNSTLFRLVATVLSVRGFSSRQELLSRKAFEWMIQSCSVVADRPASRSHQPRYMGLALPPFPLNHPSKALTLLAHVLPRNLAIFGRDTLHVRSSSDFVYNHRTTPR